MGKAVNARTEQAQGNGAPVGSNPGHRWFGKEMPELNLWFTHTHSYIFVCICIYMLIHTIHICV